MILTPRKKTAKKDYHQTGKSVASHDNQRKARLPGKRVSKSGNVYLERRKNRSDTPTERKRFASTKRPKTPAPKKAAAPMAVIYGPYLTGDTGYTLKRGKGQWEEYWCIRQGWRKNNKSPFVWSSSEAVTMGHISMDRGETAALQYLAEVAKRKGWKQMYPKKGNTVLKPGIQTPPKERRAAKPKIASNLPSLYECSHSFYKVTKTKQSGWTGYYSLFVQSKPEYAVSGDFVPRTKRLAWSELGSRASSRGIFTNDRNKALEKMAEYAKYDGLTPVDPNKKESSMTKPKNERIKE